MAGIDNIKIEFSVTLPEAGDDLGRWLDRNGGHISIDCQLGTYSVTVTWGEVHEYSDKRGMHKEIWEVSRRGKDLQDTLSRAMSAALAIFREEEPKD